MAVFEGADGTPRLAVGDLHGPVRVWDPGTGTQFGQLATGTQASRIAISRCSRVQAMAAFEAPDGTSCLATGGEDGLPRIWDPLTEGCLLTIAKDSAIHFINAYSRGLPEPTIAIGCGSGLAVFRLNLLRVEGHGSSNSPATTSGSSRSEPRMPLQNDAV
ncbi:hypothetical protein ABT272_31130 [Streptomyces sp900105245]|uniref:Uncharacterized protein n=1 Tax=Streptomyces sp. 900105245 TaxID=3154379 RepID=A0ABV1UFX6_9ACTN